MDSGKEINKEQVIKIIKEIKNNFFKFIEYVPFYHEGQYKPFSQVIYEKQKEVVNNILQRKYVIILKSRQIGISNILQIFLAWLLLFHHNLNVGIISRRSSESTSFNKKIIEIIDNFPLWLTGHKKIGDRYLKKTEQSFQLVNGSSCVCEAVSKSEPEKVFRGRTLHFVIVDEAAFIAKIENAFTALAPATFKGHHDLDKTKTPYGIVIVSTPNGIVKTGEWFYKKWTEAISEAETEGGSFFYPMKIHYRDTPFVTDDWLEKIKKIIPDPNDWDQEMELKFIVPKESLLGEFSKQLQNNYIDPLEIETKSFEFMGEIFINKVKWFVNKSYLRSCVERIFIGVDVASAFGSTSNTAVEIFGLTLDKQLTQVGEIIGKMPIIALKKLILDLAMREFTDFYPLVIIENNSYAQKLCEELANEIPGMLYWHEKEKIPGIKTTGKSKSVIIDAIYWLINKFPEGIKSERLVNDLIGIVNLKKISDSVMALGMIAYAIYRNPLLLEGSSFRDNRVMKEIISYYDRLENLSHNYLDLSTSGYKDVELSETGRIIEKIFEGREDTDEQI